MQEPLVIRNFRVQQIRPGVQGLDDRDGQRHDEGGSLAVPAALDGGRHVPGVGGDIVQHPKDLGGGRRERGQLQ